mmetsp:Transcript_15308/g.34686  ORF Transcript_15308/g.34686 Transcript_15308/m.34686 type:complete len:235 (-) Transcript_15308:248-952(-)
MPVGQVLETNRSDPRKEIVKMKGGENVVVSFRDPAFCFFRRRDIQVDVGGTTRVAEISSVDQRRKGIGLVPVRASPSRHPVAPFVPRCGLVSRGVADPLDAMTDNDRGMVPRPLLRRTLRGSLVDLCHRPQPHPVRSAPVNVVIDLVDDVADPYGPEKISRQHLVHVRQDPDVVGFHAELLPAGQDVVSLGVFPGYVLQLRVFVGPQTDARLSFRNSKEPRDDFFVLLLAIEVG